MYPRHVAQAAHRVSAGQTHRDPNREVSYRVRASALQITRRKEQDTSVRSWPYSQLEFCNTNTWNTFLTLLPDKNPDMSSLPQNTPHENAAGAEEPLWRWREGNAA